MHQFNKASAEELQFAILAAITAVCDKHGLVASRNGGTIGQDSYTLKFKFAPNAAEKAEAKAADPDAEWRNFTALASSVGADPLWYGKQIMLNGHRFTVTGIAPSRSKNCIRIKRSDGRAMICPPEAVRDALARAA